MIYVVAAILGLALAWGFTLKALSLGFGQPKFYTSLAYYGLSLFFALLLGHFSRKGSLSQGLFPCLLVGQVLWMAYTDWKTGYFFNRDLYFLALLSFLHYCLWPNFFVLVASSLAFLFFYGIEKLTGGFGEGDKYFVFLTSLWFRSPWLVYHYLSITFILAGAICGLLYLVKNWDRKREVALGPFLGVVFISLYFIKEVL